MRTRGPLTNDERSFDPAITPEAVAPFGVMAGSLASRARPRRPVARAVAAFAAAGIVALAAVAFATNAVSRRAGTDTAIRDSRRDAAVLTRIAIEPALTDGLLDGDPAAIAAMDREVRQRVLDADLVRVKLWRSDG